MPEDSDEVEHKSDMSLDEWAEAVLKIENSPPKPASKAAVVLTELVKEELLNTHPSRRERGIAEAFGLKFEEPNLHP